MAPEGVSAGGAALRGCPGHGVWASGESDIKGRVPTGPGKEWDPLALAGAVRDSLSADARPGATASRCAEGHWAASLAPKGATNSRSRWHRFSLGCFCEVQGPRRTGESAGACRHGRLAEPLFFLGSPCLWGCPSSQRILKRASGAVEAQFPVIEELTILCSPQPFQFHCHPGPKF